MSDILTPVRQHARQYAASIARWLDRVSGGKLTPAMVTWTGLVMHLPIAYLIAVESWYWAAGLLVIFGLFDILDGGLAKVQGTASARGMLLDASTDRMKEVLLYSGAAYWLAQSAQPANAAWAVAACGASICVSYIKAKGEAAVAAGENKIPHATLNRMFADGLLTFEVRMALLVIGLLVGQLLPAVVLIAVFSTFTAFQRLFRISRALT